MVPQPNNPLCDAVGLREDQSRNRQRLRRPEVKCALVTLKLRLYLSCLVMSAAPYIRDSVTERSGI